MKHEETRESRVDSARYNDAVRQLDTWREVAEKMKRWLSECEKEYDANRGVGSNVH